MITQKTSKKELLNEKELATSLAERGDLPATTRILKLVSQISAEDPISAQDLANVILKDYGLTKKVIQMANSCFYNPQGVEIVTVSKAIIFLGFDTIRKIALATSYLEEVLSRTPSERRKEVLSLMSRSFFGAFVAGRLSASFGLGQEEFFIHLPFHRLIRLLLAVNFPSEYEVLGRLEAENPIAVKEILYLVGERVGRKWALPHTIVEIFEGSPKTADQGHPAYLVSSLDTAIQAIFERNDRKLLKDFLRKHHLEARLADDLIEEAYKATLGLYQPFIKFFSFWPEKEKPSKETKPPSQEEFFQKALSEITSLLASGKDLQQVLLMVMETISRAFECEKVLLGVYRPKGRELTIRYALGVKTEKLKGKIYPIGRIVEEIFRKGTEWAGKKSAVPEFAKVPEIPEADILFSPLVVLGKPLGMFLALRSKPFSTEEIQKVAILRNLAVMSIIQAQKRTKE